MLRQIGPAEIVIVCGGIALLVGIIAAGVAIGIRIAGRKP